jgi:hypothetical protein
MSFDPAKLIAAAKAAAQAKPVPIKLAGIGDAFKRKLTVADIEAAGSVRERMEKAGKLNQQMNIAIGLAQAICGPDGQPVFDIENDEHLTLLASLPFEAVRGAMGDEGNG